MRQLLALATLAFFTSCTIPQTAIEPTLTEVDRPPLNTEQTAEIGDTMVEKGRIASHKSIILDKEVFAGDGFMVKKFTVTPQVLVGNMESKDWVFYYGDDHVLSYDAMLGTTPEIGGLAVHKEDPNKVKIFAAGGAVLMTPRKAPEITYGTTYAKGTRGLKQELIYNGISGDSAKFLYREYSSDMIRGDFSQEVQYDLAQDRIIGLKGLRVEVIDATNTSITYRVLQTFPGLDAPGLDAN